MTELRTHTKEFPMRGLLMAGGLAIALVAGGVGAAKPAADDTYDLRGPAPKEKQVLVTKTTFKIKAADVVIKIAGMTLNAKQDLFATSEEEVKTLTVGGRQATKVQTKVTKDKVETVTTLGGQEIKDNKTGDLHGEILISERTGEGKWKHKLVDTQPTEDQKKDLDKRLGPENQDDLYPSEKVKVGHEWTVDAPALQRMFGGSITDLKGKLKMKLVKIEEVDGEECAVIESSGKITGVAKEDEGTLDVELDMKGTTWRSIKTGVDVKDKAEGKIKMSGKIEMDGAKADIELTGPITIDSTSKLK
jgi:hypothetical protein